MRRKLGIAAAVLFGQIFSGMILAANAGALAFEYGFAGEPGGLEARVNGGREAPVMSAPAMSTTTFKITISNDGSVVKSLKVNGGVDDGFSGPRFPGDYFDAAAFDEASGPSLKAPPAVSRGGSTDGSGTYAMAPAKPLVTLPEPILPKHPYPPGPPLTAFPDPIKPAPTLISRED